MNRRTLDEVPSIRGEQPADDRFGPLLVVNFQARLKKVRKRAMPNIVTSAVANSGARAWFTCSSSEVFLRCCSQREKRDSDRLAVTGVPAGGGAGPVRHPQFRIFAYSKLPPGENEPLGPPGEEARPWKDWPA